MDKHGKMIYGTKLRVVHSNESMEKTSDQLSGTKFKGEKHVSGTLLNVKRFMIYSKYYVFERIFFSFERYDLFVVRCP